MMRLLVALVSTGLLVALSTGASSAEIGTAEGGTRAEAWHSRGIDACEEDLDCSLLPDPAAYPERTLHVSISAGSTTAETYLELDIADVPEDQDITGGTLTLPVNTEPRDGSLQPEEAQLMACVVTEFVDSSQGSFEDPPQHDCDTAAPAQFTDKPEPTFTVDLAPFAAEWAEGATPRVAIVPANDATDAGDTWHVTFWGRDNESDDAKPITAELDYGTGEDDFDQGLDEGLTGLEDRTGPEVLPAPEPPPEPGLVGAAAPEIADAPPEEAPASEEPEAVAAPQPQAAVPQVSTIGYQYPIAWIMPLILLIGFVITGRTLTGRLAPPSTLDP